MAPSASDLAPVLLAHRDGLPAFGPDSVLTEAHVELVPLLLVLVPAAVYLFGVRRLTARGDRWALGRTLSFVVGGLGTVAVATLSGLGAYDESLFSTHMVQHMLLTMVAPVFLALGAPITLALRTLPASPRGTLLAVLHSRFARLLTFPLVPWVLFVASPFALYFTGLYDATLDNRLLHEWLHVHFLVVGALFFWPLLGADPVPGRRSHPFAMLLVALTLPFHAFLGVAIMSIPPDGSGLIARAHYLAQHPLEEAVFQQELGGGLLWASGDVVGLLFVFVLATQWMRASEREAAREDRRLDRLEAAERQKGMAAEHRAALAANVPAELPAQPTAGVPAGKPAERGEAPAAGPG